MSCLKEAGRADGGRARSLLPAEAFDVCIFKEFSKLKMCLAGAAESVRAWIRARLPVCACVRENASESVQDGLREAERGSTAPFEDSLAPTAKDNMKEKANWIK